MDNGRTVAKGSIAKRMTLVITLLLLFAGLLSTSFLPSKEKGFKGLRYKTLEFEIQVIFFGIAGGVIIQTYTCCQSRRTALNESRKAALCRLIDAYSRTKKIRRNIREKCKSSACDDSNQHSKTISYESCQEQFDPINTTQLSLESLAREPKVIKIELPEQKILLPQILTIKNPLNRFIDEFERTPSTFSLGQNIPLESTPLLGSFIAKGS
ncbi:hypothetical protein [Pseudomonas schmalbachii]|uniref:Uncharacterized protein n=1 Tax=Pseudomonas schmalbachii TaxID=2816993 RepID=A0ABS3TJW5_9PSED|nr:hypothetical protein [Pseudomonas schmalbachii]MBO3273683.1 hypothetical protein [Pseudomonas schmalbachii]